MKMRILTHGTPNNSAHVSAFDMDWTLIKPHNGRTLARNRDDWQWRFSNAHSTLRARHDSGHSVVIFTHQPSVAIAQSFLSAVDVPLHLVMADKQIKKPGRELWDQYLEQTDHVAVQTVWYCGDAADPTDWSQMDRQFAENIGATFTTPEELFVGQIQWRPFQLTPQELSLPTSYTFILVMVGYMASGKTTLAHQLAARCGATVVSGDNHGTQNSMKKQIMNLLCEQRSVIVDATNATAKKRSTYSLMGVPTWCCIMDVNIDEAMENNMIRHRLLGRPKIPSVALFKFRSNYEEPQHFDQSLHAKLK